MAGGRMMTGYRAEFCLGFGLLAACLAGLPVAFAQDAQYPSAPQLKKDGTSVLLEDYASLPFSSLKKDGPYPSPIDYRDQLGRANSLRSEPADAPNSDKRFFVPGQNGVLYILDKSTRQFTPYVDFGKIFPKFTTEPVYGLGLVSIAFDPGYAKNGKFYTVHTERPGISGSAAPRNDAAPNLTVNGDITAAINSPAGEVGFQSIIYEWTDTNISNSTFEGSAREILRAGLNFPLHPMADMLFNPLAGPGHPDYGNLYISVGDGTAGERAGVTHPIPQRLDALQGKILRITPDISLRPQDMPSSNGRYRIPSTGTDPNPFVSAKGARPEVFVYGLRNPHRITWDPVTNTFLAADIGDHSWEEINIIIKGGNYGWAEREGPELRFTGGPNGGKTATQIDPPVPYPSEDTLAVDGLDKPVTLEPPVAYYSHWDGLAVGSGYVYRGKLMPQLVGKYIFTEITTGRFFYADLAEMIANKGKRGKGAAIHEIEIVYKNPYDSSAQGPVKRRMYDIAADAFVRKGGITVRNTVLPGASSITGGFRGGNITGGKVDPYGVPYGGGRADVRLARGGDDEIYVISKSDGMIRKLVSVVTPPPGSKNSAAR